MTEAELDKTLTAVCSDLEGLSKADSLSKDESRCRQVLLLKKNILEKMKDAKQKGSSSDEIHAGMAYALMTSRWGERHPYLASLVMGRFKWSVF